ncbi:hypothetical protein Angca_001407, partial [Angiostrongylus cantonensis]
VEFFNIVHSELVVARVDASLLVVRDGITSQFQYLSSKVLEYGSQVNCHSTSYTSSIVAFMKHSMRMTD